mmetsp:Transcript_19273/g.21835  ORF Transcript_19273/g.21835 Transcript_19273/m.21835 type:complete len:429 (+) Transcript_19273:256-1542(+)
MQGYDRRYSDVQEEIHSLKDGENEVKEKGKRSALNSLVQGMASNMYNSRRTRSERSQTSEGSNAARLVRDFERVFDNTAETAKSEREDAMHMNEPDDEEDELMGQDEFEEEEEGEELQHQMSSSQMPSLDFESSNYLEPIRERSETLESARSSQFLGRSRAGTKTSTVAQLESARSIDSETVDVSEETAKESKEEEDNKVEEVEAEAETEGDAKTDTKAIEDSYEFVEESKSDHETAATASTLNQYADTTDVTQSRLDFFENLRIQIAIKFKERNIIGAKEETKRALKLLAQETDNLKVKTLSRDFSADLARCHLELLEAEEAIEITTLLLKGSPSDHDYLCMRARAHHILNQHGDAITDLETAFKNRVAGDDSFADDLQFLKQIKREWDNKQKSRLSKVVENIIENPVVVVGATLVVSVCLLYLRLK